MKQILLAIVFFALISGCNQQSTKLNNVDLNAERENVALVLEKYVIANEKEDIDLVHEIWAASPDIVVFGTNSDEKIVGWEAIKEALERQYSAFEDTYISVRDQVIHIDPTGNFAWFSEMMNYNYIYQGEAKQFEGLRFTGVLQKIDGVWYIVQSHISIPGEAD
ncbi:MAG: nuclear transport factor 2 family protein [Bacteroidetes bacterium]|nr:nuclear transport factor 2 family protein [Bacteroidota bacterium]